MQNEILNLIKSSNEDDVVLGLRMLGSDLQKNIEFFEENFERDPEDFWIHAPNVETNLTVVISDEVSYSLGATFIIIAGYSLDIDEKGNKRLFTLKMFREQFQENLIDFRYGINTVK